ncbi:hypothetical protein V8C44DRAFT_263243 [Trichoderma aethiopicum]
MIQPLTACGAVRCKRAARVPQMPAKRGETQQCLVRRDSHAKTQRTVPRPRLGSLFRCDVRRPANCAGSPRPTPRPRRSTNHRQLRPASAAARWGLFERFSSSFTPLLAEAATTTQTDEFSFGCECALCPWLDLSSRVGAVEDVLRSPVPTSKQFWHDELPGVVTLRASSLSMITDGCSFGTINGTSNLETMIRGQRTLFKSRSRQACFLIRLRTMTTRIWPLWTGGLCLDLALLRLFNMQVVAHVTHGL